VVGVTTVVVAGGGVGGECNNANRTTITTNAYNHSSTSSVDGTVSKVVGPNNLQQYSDPLSGIHPND